MGWLLYSYDPKQVRKKSMEKNGPQGEIVIFFTGGTISMSSRPDEGGVVPSGDFDRLLTELNLDDPGIRLKPVYWDDLPSPHMTPEHMFHLANDIAKALSDPAVLGAVVLHGTDVLVESAFMADLIVESPKPIVFTGSMRYFGELGFDGIRNLLGGIKACLLPLPPETGVVLFMTDRFFAARDVVKINSLNIDAFEAPETGPVGYIAGKTILLPHNPASSSISRERTVLKANAFDPNVVLLTCYTGMNGDLIEHVRDQKISGLVLEGFGAGNVPPAIVPSLVSLIQENIPVVLTTRCIEGGVWPIYAYPGGAADLQKKGVIMGGRLSGPKARILLMVTLGLTYDLNEIRKLFNHYCS
jgi:L-asparaginase